MRLNLSDRALTPTEILQILNEKLPLPANFKGNHAFILDREGHECYLMWDKNQSFTMKCDGEGEIITMDVLEENIRKVLEYRE